jgi:hypothetical protein
MNEGFRALPEEVQKKILGKAGGGVMQRPLFRQMGGPTEPMPQDMAQGAQQEGQMLGQEIAARTQESIDAATDVEGAINALRGNDMPLDARYQELAGLVGERDAMQTPESVLALTEPAIMMTQQGAMDSGIGELMQAVAGDTQMDQGMDQGLGALMMQGAGSTPPENFRRGGPVEVRGYQAAGEVKDGGGTRLQPMQMTDFDPYMERAMAARENILGTSEERAAQLARAQQQARSDALFNLANFGLAFAGETQGGSVAERLANAAARSNVVGGFQQAGRDVEARRREMETQDQSMRLSALQSAENMAEADRGRSFDLLKIGVQKEADLEKMREANNLAVENAATQQDYNLALVDARGDIQKSITNLQISAQEAIASGKNDLARDLQDKQAQLQKDLVKLNAEADLNNSIAKFNLTSIFELEKMEMGQEFELAKLATQNGYEQIAREDQQQFTAAQNALSRAQTADLANIEQEVRLELANKGIEQQELDREVRVTMQKIQNAFEEHRLLQGDEQLSLQAMRDAVDKAYKARSLAIDEAAMRLKGVDIKNNNDLQAYLTGKTQDGEYRIDAFLNGDLENPLDYEGKLIKYTSPSREWNETTKRYESTPGLKLPAAMNDRLKAERPDLYEQVTGKKAEPAQPVELDEDTQSVLFKDVVDPEAAFGSGGLVRDLVNKAFEAFSFGAWNAPATKTKEAIVAVDNLNSEFVNFFTQAAEIRESVFQQQKLDQLTPKSAQFWQGSDEAKSKATALLRRIQQAEQLVIDRMNSENVPSDSAEYSKMDKQLRQLANLRAGYQVLSNMAAAIDGAEGGENEEYFDDLFDKMRK